MHKIITFFNSKKGNIFDILFVSLIYYYLILVVIPFRNVFPILLSAYFLGGFVVLYITFISHYFHQDNWADRGFGSFKTFLIRTDNLRKSANEILFITFLLVLIILIISIMTGSIWLLKTKGFSKLLVQKVQLFNDSVTAYFLVKLVLYISWGFFQQILFLSFINVRLNNIFTEKIKKNKILVSLIAGFIFSCYHIFNFPLMIFAFIAGTLWAWSFYDSPNLFTVSVSHGLCGTLASIFIFDPLGLNMNIGWPGFMI